MRLSRGELVFVGFVLAVIVLFSICNESNERLQTIRSHSVLASTSEGIPSGALPTLELFQEMQEVGISLKEWTVYWRGTIGVEEKESLLQWIEEDPLFIKQSEAHHPDWDEGSPVQTTWEKRENNTIHQLKIISYPQEKKQNSNYIYTWSGTQLEPNWVDAYQDTEQRIVTHLKKIPEIFTCLEGFTSDKLNFDLSVVDHALSQIIYQLDGTVTHQMADANFLSMNGYISTWGKRFLPLENDQKMNIQLSARFNALLNQTQVTIGYPLILKEH